MKFEPRAEFDRERNAVSVAGAHMVIHCHHYNSHLLQAMEESGFVDPRKVIGGSVEGSIYRSLNEYLAAHSEIDSIEDRLEIATDMFRYFGFGLLDMSGVSDVGGTARAPSSHFATGWMAKWGHRKTPCCYFTVGYIAGAVEAVFGKPIGYYDVVEKDCLSTGADSCRFTVEVREDGN
jgi:predicted hydrocarbon binding protein